MLITGRNEFSWRRPLIAKLRQTSATRNRQGLANQMPLPQVKQALALTEQLLKPGELKSGLDAYLRQQGN